MSNANIVAQDVCPTCLKTIVAEGFSYHFCDDAYAVTLDGSFHSYQRNETLARTYLYRTARRQQNAGIEVTIAPAAPVAEDDSAYDDYYGGAYLSDDEIAQEQAELLAAAAEHEAQQAEIAEAIDRLRWLGVEQAAAAASWADDDDLPIISLVATPAPMPIYTRLAA